jgi:ATP-dependent DNA helicase RecG
LNKALKTRPPVTLETAVTYLKGCGPALATRLRQLGIERIQDLLFHLPSRYEDRRRLTPVVQLVDGNEALVRARILHAEVRYAGRRSLRVLVDDGSAPLLLRFFHFNEAQKQALAPGRWVQAFGNARHGAQGWEMVHPEYRAADAPEGFSLDTALTPIYPLSTGLTQARLRILTAAALEVAEREATLRRAIPGLEGPDTISALRLIHQPRSEDDVRLLLQVRHPAQQRLIREELLAHQLCMRWLRGVIKDRPAPTIGGLPAAREALTARLPFALTRAQQRVLEDIGRDLAQPRPMLRLVQGDVGCGKTLVAACAMHAAARAGYQSALMAPTELLAEQHALNFTHWLAPLGVTVVLLSGRQKKAEREASLRLIASGEAAIVVGTHAIFQDSVQFAKLALAVVDEQHRFGVQQRLALRDKGARGLTPHQLIMSATPIPRTLAQTLYADLDVSIIDQLPPGRTPVKTVAFSNERRAEVLARIGEVCAAGRQAYWVCTLVEESDQLEAQAAEDTERLLREELPQLQIGLVHGRMKAELKDAQMRAFKEGRTQLLVATTVIEVGVDVPNASIMIIENAERLGLSQLHQLRGRVGRGKQESQCVLMYQPPLSAPARARLAVMRETHDGFVIAQKDLELRGPGELLGRRQTGVVGLRIADPVRDSALLEPLQEVADALLTRAPADARALIHRWVGNMERYAQV